MGEEPLAGLDAWRGRAVTVLTRASGRLRGTLRACDEALNLVLDGAEGDVVVNGGAVVAVALTEPPPPLSP